MTLHLVVELGHDYSNDFYLSHSSQRNVYNVSFVVSSAHIAQRSFQAYETDQQMNSSDQ